MTFYIKLNNEKRFTKIYKTLHDLVYVSSLILCHAPLPIWALYHSHTGLSHIPQMIQAGFCFIYSCSPFFLEGSSSSLVPKGALYVPFITTFIHHPTSFCFSLFLFSFPLPTFYSLTTTHAPCSRDCVCLTLHSICILHCVPQCLKQCLAWGSSQKKLC